MTCALFDGEEQRVAVLRRLRRRDGADVAAGADAVLDDDRLPEFSANFCAKMRAIVSLAPPAACGTISVIGLEG